MLLDKLLYTDTHLSAGTRLYHIAQIRSHYNMPLIILTNAMEEVSGQKRSRYGADDRSFPTCTPGSATATILPNRPSIVRASAH